MPLKMQIFTFLFLMLGPFKIIAPFAQLTKNADTVLTRKIAIRGTLYASIILFLAAFLGQSIMSRYGIPNPIMALTGGVILFLVALLNIIKQFNTPEHHKESDEPPSTGMAMYPLAFPTIVTPYGIAAVIVFVAISPDLQAKLTVGTVVLGIMVLNLVLMLITKLVFKPLAIILSLLGAVLGVVQVALGISIIFNQMKKLLAG